MEEIFWGLWLFPFGLLVYLSGFIPRFIGVWLIINCFGFVLSFTALFFRNPTTPPLICAAGVVRRIGIHALVADQRRQGPKCFQVRFSQRQPDHCLSLGHEAKGNQVDRIVILVALLLAILVGFIAYWRSTNDCDRKTALVNPMKAIRFCEYGSPDVLKFADVEKPVPNDNQVLIKVRAASLNFIDPGLMRGPWLLRLMSRAAQAKEDTAGHRCGRPG